MRTNGGGRKLKQSYGKVYSRDYIRCAIVAALTLLGLIGLLAAGALVKDFAEAVTA